MTTEVSKRVRGKRSIKLADCTDLLIVIESGHAPNIHWQFGSAPVAPVAAAAPVETMKVENVATPPAEAPKKHGFRRRKAQAPEAAAPAPAPAPPQAAPAAETAPKKKGGFKFRGKDQEAPAALCSAQRLLEYKGKSGKWHQYAVVGSGEVKKQGGKWPQGTRFVQLRFVATDDQGKSMIVGSTFPVKEADFAEKVRNVRRFNPAQDNCGCDLCQSK